MTAQNKQIVLELIRLAADNRTSDALALLHPAATWWVAGDPQRLKVAGLKNRAQAERLLEGVKKAIPGGMRMIVHGVTAENDRVAVEAEGDGIWRDGRQYHNHYHFLFEVRDGLICGVREYMDTLHLYDVSQSS